MEREVGEAGWAVAHYSAVFLRDSRAREAAGAHFVGMVGYERSCRERAEGLLARIAQCLEDLASSL